ncbi:MAG TPA: hypothetical protein VKB09_10360 [Thermomicrobiales bacterium]|nr:hypothetical protein [Thermomicrobiales bacterium]
MTGIDSGSGDRVRLAELVAALSLASELAIDEPMEHALRRCLISVGLGQALGLGDEELTTVYDLALLRSIGCTAEQHERSRRVGNEQPLARRYASTHVGRRAASVRAADSERTVAEQAAISAKAWYNRLS